MGNDSVGALHVALVAAVVGWLVFSISHTISVWRKRNASGNGTSGGLGFIGLGVALCLAGLLAGWLNSQLTRRAGVILGTDFFVVRSHGNATAHLLSQGNAHTGDRLATFDDAEANRKEDELSGEIAVLQQQIAIVKLQPLVVSPELLRLSQLANDSQRARVTQLGYGVVGDSHNDGTANRLSEDDMVAAQRARYLETASQLVRTKTLMDAGVVARRDLDAANSAAMMAAQDFRERQRLIQITQAGSQEFTETERPLAADLGRARLERSAEVAELEVKSAEIATSLFDLRQERLVLAPFDGTIVYRHPAPALAGEGQVLLALATGPGFLATVQIPAREAASLILGQELRMKLEQVLTNQEVSGRLQAIQPVQGNPGLSELLVQCDLPGEQFATLSSGAVQPSGF
jgi:hypothetical protein